jgi:hypothetical protein
MKQFILFMSTIFCLLSSCSDTPSVKTPQSERMTDRNGHEIVESMPIDAGLFKDLKFNFNNTFTANAVTVYEGAGTVEGVTMQIEEREFTWSETDHLEIQGRPADHGNDSYFITWSNPEASQYVYMTYNSKHKRQTIKSVKVIGANGEKYEYMNLSSLNE